MTTGHVKNWAEFQHYKDRSPPWLKLHRGLLDNMEYALLSPEAAKALPLIWLIASEFDGGLPEIPQLAFRLRCSVDAATAIYDELLKAKFLCLKDAAPAERLATPAQQAGWGSRHISDKVKREAWIRDNGKCVSCESVSNIEYDHVIPVSLGGGSELSNIQLLCRTCNRRKRASVATPVQPLRSLETEREAEGERETEGEVETLPVAAKGRKTRLPAGFAVSGRVEAWAASKGHARLADRLEHFRSAALAKGYEYVDWDEAFMTAVRSDWAGFGTPLKASIPGGGRREL